MPRSVANRRSAVRFGRLAEWLCRTALRLQGYTILAANVKTPVGELDIVARRRDVIVFVEVKARDRATDRDGHAGEVLSRRQRQRIERAAEWYLQPRPALAVLGRRFDLMRVAPRRWPDHVRDAWRPDA